MRAFRRQHASFRYYGELNDFLPPFRRFVSISHGFELPASVKDMIESMGVPHTEVDLILHDGTPVDFAHLVQNGDRISVFPTFRALDVSPVLQLRPRLQDHHFILDSHLGRLATYLRLLGFDALYRNDFEDAELARASHCEQRVLLTRDRGLLKRNEVIYGYFIRATEARRQAVEVLRRFGLSSSIAPFCRCLRCNVLLNPVAKESVIERLQPKTRRYYDEFRICPACNRLFWDGCKRRSKNRSQYAAGAAFCGGVKVVRRNLVS
ncbi:MAG: twitching motility protein PilT [Acidobacteria bacterium]|nr:MAG: twitching motility protein PilT [Acidobacteriota bacterium]